MGQGAHPALFLCKHACCGRAVRVSRATAADFEGAPDRVRRVRHVFVEPAYFAAGAACDGADDFRAGAGADRARAALPRALLGLAQPQLQLHRHDRRGVCALLLDVFPRADHVVRVLSVHEGQAEALPGREPPLWRHHVSVSRAGRRFFHALSQRLWLDCGVVDRRSCRRRHDHRGDDAWCAYAIDG